MSDFTDSQKKKYLAETLRLNPVHQADKIIHSRNRMLGKACEDTIDLEDQTKRNRLRAKTNEQIAQIRSQMWRTAPQRLNQQLNAIDFGQLPEMKNAADRLQVVINHHGQFQQLSHHPRLSPNLVNTFRRVVMSAPRESGSIKEAYLRQITQSPELRQIQGSVGIIYAEFPQLYGFEADWFSQIASLKRRSSRGSGGSSSGIAPWLVWVVFVVVFRLIATWLRSS